MTLHVERAGRGAPLFLLHGWGFHSGVWKDLAAALAKRFEVLAVDLPGHGHSHATPLGALDPLVDDLAADVPHGSFICGWSMGAIVAQRLARRHPERVRGLALISATPCFVARKDWPHGMATSTLEEFAAGVDRDPAATLESFVRLNALGGPDPRGAMRALGSRLRDRPFPSATALAAGLEILRSADLRADASCLNVRTCIVHGAHDHIVPVEAGRWLARTIPAAHLVELPGCAHFALDAGLAPIVRAVEALDA